MTDRSQSQGAEDGRSPETFREFLRGETAIVTGASRGIGAAVAVELARLGADVGLVQRGEAAETRAAVESLDRRAVTVRCDLADPEAAVRAVEAAGTALGRLDVCVSNAGLIDRQAALDVPLGDFERVLDVDLVSAFAVTQAAARRFLAEGRAGRIVHVASLTSFHGSARAAAYAAAKGGVAQLAKAQANEWAGLGIRVNAIAPGWVETELTRPHRDDPARNAELVARTPAGRWADPAEIAEAVAYLVSPAARFVHGHVLVVDGGYLGR